MADEKSRRCGESLVPPTDQPPPEGDDDDAQLDLPLDGAEVPRRTLPHPQGGTRWQAVISAQVPGVPLLYGRPER